MHSLSLFMQNAKDDVRRASTFYHPRPSVQFTFDNNPNRNSKSMVSVRVVFLKIGEIDTPKEQYSAEVNIQSRWFEPTLNGKSEEVSSTQFRATEIN